ncbi:phosphoadenylyl-sulfate reductase [Mesorhizobium sp.]|uniref:phosphoadenylyl-sulfate reductase n=1 Tax=Mesorhizobium sp. TaxID=1871066 RepID=UPI0011F680F8|nr:phosphoadenylyl-sulfate reductase [Mesorhizobium sp.]TIO08555.1 MAG: phosphoadenylyl-sulfate reductase [Mesorhizobium sp.]TIO33800.1 MAG: phosphoadenylyl-sulfate reductase [Mesorhizobium sp.]TIP13160.1 MAG: phosphoadenylyl-sulfate reductase [Mesorhizobium sp.]
MLAKPRPLDRIVDVEAGVAAEAAGLDALYGHLKPLEIIERSAREFFYDEIAAVSSFGADSAVLLHMIAKIDRTLPVIFLDTGKHFEETLDYRDALVADFGLTDIRVITPDEAALERVDPTGNLNETDTDACCDVRKVEPLARGVEPFRAWFTGRKRFQASTRAALPVFEAVGSRIRINPLAHWTTADQASYMRAHALRENPLVAYGYLSIGCFPCTQPVQPGEDARSGRWAGHAKTECGIHLSGLEKSLTDASL